MLAPHRLHMSIRIKLLLAFLTQILLLGCVGVIISLQLSTAQSRVDEIKNNAIPSLSQLNDLSVNISRYRILQAMHMASTNEDTMVDVEKEMQQTEKKISGMLATYTSFIIGEAEQKDLTQIQKRWPLLVTQTQRSFLPYSRTYQYERALLAYRESQPNYDIIQNSITKLIAEKKGQGQVSADQAQSATKVALSSLILVLALGFITSIVVGLIITRLITKNLHRVMKAAAAVEQGDLEQHVPVPGKDEIGQLARSFNAMLNGLQQAQQERLTYQATLEQRVVERTRDLENTMGELKASLDARNELAATVRALSTPIIPVRRDALVMPLVGLLDTERSEMLITTLLNTVEQQRARAVIIDVTGVPLIDTATAQSLLQATAMLRLLGAQTVLVGLRPELAQTIVSLGVDLSSLHVQADLEAGINSLSTLLRRDRSSRAVKRSDTVPA